MERSEIQSPNERKELRRGWTTGACATAATKSALCALLTGDFADPVSITLPGGQTPVFALAHEARGDGWAEAGIIKDAGDDPDVTHGALIIARVEKGVAGSGITFIAGDGVGRVTKPGLPLKVGEPAINPVPRKMMGQVVAELCAAHRVAADIMITVSVPDGAEIATKTWNPRLGILGGISILGTTGIVVPYSCAAWIHSIQRGVDVAQALGLKHVVGSTGDTSEKAAMAHLGLPQEAYIDMGDFVGGMLKYVRRTKIEKVTIAGGFAKLTKLAQGAMDLHSARAQVDVSMLAEMLEGLGGDAKTLAACRAATTANEILQMAENHGLPLAGEVAKRARTKAMDILSSPHVKVGVLVVDRLGRVVAEAE